MSIVRIKKKNGGEVGAGFLVAKRHVLTCAHVVADALDLGVIDDETERPQGEVHLDFPLQCNDPGEATADCKAHVEYWQPRAGRDIAILQLNGDPHEAARPARLTGARVKRKVLALIEFPPQGHGNRQWTNSRMRDGQGNGGLHIESTRAVLRGGPVVEGRKLGRDHVVGSIVGIMVKSTGDQAGSVIPTKVLVEPWPKLKPQPLVFAAVIAAIMGIVVGGFLVYSPASDRGGNNGSADGGAKSGQNDPSGSGNPPCPEPTTNPDDIFLDDFSDFSDPCRWSVDETEGGSYQYTDGGYQLNASPPDGGTHAQADDAGILGDVIVEVDALRLGDASDKGISYFGIACRVQDEYGEGMIEDGYFMGVYDYGLVQFRMRKDGDGDYIRLAGTEQYRERIPKGEENHIRADCVGNKLSLYVNDEMVLEKDLEDEDAEFESGRVGLFVLHTSDKEPDTKILFDDFEVSKVE